MDQNNQTSNHDPLRYESVGHDEATKSSNLSGGGAITQKKKIGPIIVTLVIILVAVIVALYVFASSLNQERESTSNTENNTTNEIGGSATESVQTITNDSDDVQSLQDDLEKSVNGVDSQDF